MKEGGGGGKCGGDKKIKGGRGSVGRWTCSRTSTGRERKSGWAISMLGRR